MTVKHDTELNDMAIKLILNMPVEEYTDEFIGSIIVNKTDVSVTAKLIQNIIQRKLENSNG